MPRSNVPVRICGSKTRSGCKTCKQRHLKCDERAPICVRCERSNRCCIYDALLKRSPPASAEQKSVQLLFSSRYLDDFRSPSPERNPSPYGGHDLEEIYAVKKFAAYLGQNLAGCFSNKVWCEIAPRTAQLEPSIWHILVAVSTLDTSLQLRHRGQSGSSEFKHALGHYNKSIQELNLRLSVGQSTLSRDVVLLCSILFSVFECLQGHYLASLQHIRSGTKLLTEWENETDDANQNNSGNYLDRASLQPIFLSLRTQAIQMGVLPWLDCCDSPMINSDTRVPKDFASPDEAGLCINRIVNDMSYREQWVEPVTTMSPAPSEEWMMAEKQRQRTQLADWDAAFERLRQSHQDEPVTLLLLLQRNVVNVLFEAEGVDELRWDDFVWLFSEVVRLAEEYVAVSAYEQSFRESRPIFDSPKMSDSPPMLTVAMDVCQPLYMTSTRCREPDVRQRALNLLKTINRREGIWDSNLCARVAERIIETEKKEALETGYVPEDARIFSTDVYLDGDRSARIVHKKRLRDQHGYCYTDDVFEEMLTW